MDITPLGIQLVELAKGVSIEQIQAATDVTLIKDRFGVA